MKILKTLKHIALLVGMLLMSFVSVGQQIWYETDIIIPGEEYLIGLVDGGNVYLAVNYAPGPSNYYTSAEGANWYGYTVKACINGTNLEDIEEKYGISDLKYCTWIFEGNIQDGYIIHSGRENYYLASWSSTSYKDLYPASYSSNATKWIYQNHAFYRTVGNTKRYMQYYYLTSTNYTGSYTGPHMCVTSDEQQNNIKLYTKDFPLPISLLSFTASPQPEYNLVQWSTATEKNNDLFILERSEDAVVFDEVYNVSGAGSSLEPLDYEFRDYCPVPDITYYRLTQVDYDGSKTTSEIVSCIRTSEKMSNWEYFTRYDNLVQVHSNDKVLTIVCSDLLGRTIWQGKLLPHDDEELVLKVPYMVHIYEDGNIVGSEKILK